MILFRARTVLDKSNGKLVKNYYKQTSRMPDIWMVNIIRPNRCSDLCRATRSEKQIIIYQVNFIRWLIIFKLVN